MIALNLEAKSKEQEIIKAYLEENASETLADKINNGVTIEKDGKRLINRKTLDGFMTFACEEAKKQAAKGAKGACVADSTVFGWAIHYFEEDSIEGTLYSEDGTEYNPKPKFEQKAKPKTAEPTKPQAEQQTLFDFMDQPDENTEPIEETEQMTDFCDENREPEVSKIPPRYQRYLKIQKKYPDSVVAVRVGDFFEVYGENAVKLSEELNLTLTNREFGLPERVAAIGIPYFAVDRYIQKLVNRDFRLALVEELGDPIFYPAERSEAIDSETGEILTEAEMREFDGDIEEPKDIINDETDYSDPAHTRKLTALIGDIYIVR